MSGTTRLGVALTGHWLPLEAIARLARCADECGYEVVILDGDTTLLPRRKDAPIYAPDVLQALALEATRRVRVGAIRLPGFAHPLLLARALATLQDASGGRALGFFGVGSDGYLPRLGLPALRASERIAWLDETLEVLRPLLAGEELTFRGRFVSLERARATPPRRPVPFVVAAAQPRALALVARHADVWDANVPPLPERVLPLREHLPRDLETWIWVFARPDAGLETASAAYRRFAPWFADADPSSLAGALLCGDPRGWDGRLAALRGALGIDLPILDLAGLDERTARRALEAAAPARRSGIP